MAALTTRNGEELSREQLVAWLLQGDPAIRWQVLRDLEAAPPEVVARERARVATEGWGARVLALQDPDGRWAGALYSPKWTSTHYTLMLLHWLGLPRGNERALAGCRVLWDAAARDAGGLTFGHGNTTPEGCITAMLVLLASSFGLEDDRVDASVEWLLRNQLADGGWNCRSIRDGSTHGSFHTSISTLDAFRAYLAAGRPIDVRPAMRAGEEFFLAHRLYRSHSTGGIANPAFTKFPFPPQWHFDVVRGLEHFRAVDSPRDPRLADAVEVVRDARRTDGRWSGHRRYSGREWFALEPAGPSRWATLRARAVLDWWDAEPAVVPSL